MISAVLDACVLYWLNPVLVRETRQAVRNRTVAVLMQVYLLALVVYSFWRFHFSGVLLDNITGQTLSNEYTAIAFVAAAVTVMLHTGGRLVAERMQEDMMYVSTLRPMQIAMGKFWSGFVIAFLFYSMTLPFLTLAYLFRGADLRTVTALFILSFLLVQTLNTMVLAFFAGVRNTIDVAVRAVPFLLVAGILTWFCLMIVEDVLRTNIPVNWVIRTLPFCFIYVLIPLAMLLLAACQFAPAQSNRMYSTRRAMTWFGLVTLVTCTLVSPISPAAPFVLIWIFLGFYPFGFFALIATCERDDYGLRLRASIPKERWRRMVVFPLYTGDCNAIIWLFLWIVAAFLAVAVSGALFFDGFTMLYPIFSIILLSFNYAVAAIAVRYCLRRWIAKESTWIVVVALLVVGAVCSVPCHAYLFGQMIIMKAGWGGYWNSCWGDMWLFVPNPFWIISPGGADTEKEIQIGFALFWFLALLPFVFIWFRRRFARFVPLAASPDDTISPHCDETSNRFEK